MSPALRYKPEDEGANGSAVVDAGLYLTDSKKCFGIIRAALSLLKSVYGRPHNPNEDLIHSDLAPVLSFAYSDIYGFRGRKLRRNNGRLLRGLAAFQVVIVLCRPLNRFFLCPILGRSDTSAQDLTAQPASISDLAEISGQRGKRPEFPSGMTSGLKSTMPSWVMSRKWELGVGLAGGERCRRSGGLRS
jgi:hypothetical protein